MAAYRNRITVRLQDTDAAGVMFFANQLIYAHETYEKFMEEIGFNFSDILNRGSFLIFIVHAEADYARPVAVGDVIDVELTMARVGNTSFTIRYLLRTEAGEELGRCKTVHVTVSRSEEKKIPVPPQLRVRLEEYLDLG